MIKTVHEGVLKNKQIYLLIAYSKTNTIPSYSYIYLLLFDKGKENPQNSDVLTVVKIVLIFFSPLILSSTH